MSSSKITQDEVWRIARLARLSPSSEQAAALASDLGRILDYVAQLDRVDTSQVEARADARERNSLEAGADAREPDFALRGTVLRPDEVRPCLDREAALAEAPAAHDGGFSVPKVLEVET